MLSPFQTRKLTRRFRLYDHDGSGVIRWEDIRRTLSNVQEMSGWSMDAPERERFFLQGRTGWQLLTSAADKDFDGEVCLEDWLDFYGIILASEHAPNTLPTWLNDLSDLSFQAMDTNQDDVISFEEYARIVRAWGIGDSDPAECFHRIDANGDGHISRQEWQKLNADFYFGDDPKAASTWLWGDVFNILFK